MDRRLIISVIGARPQFIKAAPVMQALDEAFDQLLVHTGQHYDDAMSKVFFEDLSLREPHYHLAVGSGSHAAQTGLMMTRLEEVMVKERPDLVLVYGDTNSTVAGALVAAKLNIPVGHIEAGLRSFNRAMPEEINRVIADRIGNYLFCPTSTAMTNLEREGLSNIAYNVGDVMLDALLINLPLVEQHASVLTRLGVEAKLYYLATVHRASNTDEVENLKGIIAALSMLGHTVLFPIHPRTRKALESAGIGVGEIHNTRLIEPLGYLDMLALQRGAKKIITDSGGVQKEAYWLKTPCVTLRDETEWVETVNDGWNTLAGTKTRSIVQAVQNPSVPNHQAPHYGDGHAGEHICRILREKLS